MYDNTIKSRDGGLGGYGDRAAEEKEGYWWEETKGDTGDRFPSDEHDTVSSGFYFS